MTQAAMAWDVVVQEKGWGNEKPKTGMRKGAEEKDGRMTPQRGRGQAGGPKVERALEAGAAWRAALRLQRPTTLHVTCSGLAARWSLLAVSAGRSDPWLPISPGHPPEFARSSSTISAQRIMRLFLHHQPSHTTIQLYFSPMLA